MNLFTRVFKYLGAMFSGKFEERADPKIQIEQAIGESQKRHAELRKSAAGVIANQKNIETKLSRVNENLDRTKRSAREALMMARKAEQNGDLERVARMEEAAQNFAQRLIVLEDEVATLEELLINAAQASDQAKAAVTQNAQKLEGQMTERAKLLSQLGQAEMAEQMNAQMGELTSAVGQDVPTLDQVRDKIENRLARAHGEAELTAGSTSSKMFEVEQAVINSEAQHRLEGLKAELGMVEIVDVQRDTEE